VELKVEMKTGMGTLDGNGNGNWRWGMEMEVDLDRARKQAACSVPYMMKGGGGCGRTWALVIGKSSGAHRVCMRVGLGTEGRS
jgi:hypothetical protein